MNSPSDKTTMMFVTMVSMFSTQAMAAMGKLVNPETGKAERNMQVAQVMIDMLEMVRERTGGNLTDDESRLLTSTLSDLRLNYVYEMNRDTNPSSPGAAEAAAAAADGAPDSQTDENGVPPNVA